jgi:hypothetical protein
MDALVARSGPEERVSRIFLGWRPVTDGIRAQWSILAAGQPQLDLSWGSRRRVIATLWINPDFGNDHRLARVAFETGPLPELVVWRVTWHTWDREGTGGENGQERDLASAIETTIYRCLVQRYIPDLTAAEAEHALVQADVLSKAWLAERGITSMRWGGW